MGKKKQRSNRKTEDCAQIKPLCLVAWSTELTINKNIRSLPHFSSNYITKEIEILVFCSKGRELIKPEN